MSTPAYDATPAGQHTPEQIQKEMRRQIRAAYRNGQTVPFPLRALLESGVSVKVIRAVYRGKSK